MILGKGYTYEQFIDEIHLRLFGPLLMAHGYNFIIEFNELCKTPLSIEQFINQVPKPNNYNANQNPLSVDNSNEWEAYLQGEKKVIFKGWKKSLYHKYHVISPNGIDHISFANGAYPKYLSSGNEYLVQTIGDLFRITDGNLELQNVDL